MVIPRKPCIPQGIRRDYTSAPQITKAYLLGLMHDGTARKSTFRIATNSEEFSEILVKGIKKLNAGSWKYREGRSRNVWIIEFSSSLLNSSLVSTTQDKIDYIRGYFDAEGGIAKQSKVRYYLCFCQKNLQDLLEVKQYLEYLDIVCGKVHNPSKKIDPDYWRFYISAKSYLEFATIIGSYHPEKVRYLRKKR